MRYFFLFVVLFSAASCASSPPMAQNSTSGNQLRWITGDVKGLYSSVTYLTAVGSGYSRKEARADAKNALAEIFESKIKSTFSSSTSSNLMEDSDGAIKSSVQSSTYKEVNINSELVLKGVQIGKTFHDKEKNLFYALAVLNKQKTKRHYAYEMESIERKVDAKMKVFKKRQTIKKGNELIELNDSYESANQIYAMLGNGSRKPPAISEADLEIINRITNTIAMNQSIIFSYSGEQEDFGDLVQSCLTEKKLRLIKKEEIGDKKTPEGSKIVHLKLTKKELHLGKALRDKGWVHYSFKATVDITEKGKTISRSVDKSNKAVGENQCYEKVKETLSESICAKALKHLQG